MILEFDKLESVKRYKVMSQSIIPRPIAWIVTELNGVINIAPFSYFIPISSEPATIIVSIGHKSSGEKKDTLSNILETKKATICLIDEEHLDKMHFSSKELEKHISEADSFDIKTKKVLDNYPPIVDGVKSAIFCDFYKEIELEGSKTIPIILEVNSYFFEDNVIDEKLNINLNNIGRSGKEYLKDSIKVTPPTLN